MVENSEDDQQVVIDDPSPATEPTSPHLESTTPVRAGSVIVDRKQQRPHIGTVLQNYFQKKSDRNDKRSSKDHLTKFFEAMEETIRTFKPHRQVEVKRKISSIVMEYELENVREVTSHSRHRPLSQLHQNLIHDKVMGTSILKICMKIHGTLENKQPRHC